VPVRLNTRSVKNFYNDDHGTDMKGKKEFQTSKELRLFFHHHFEARKDRTDGNLRELADKCGVSP
jgi:hypothetical protein